MIAASFWSLLVPAIEISERAYNGNRKLACIPISIGFLLGALFVYLTDRFMPDNVIFVKKKIEQEKIF
jgi:zinc transporter ZupT